MLLDFGVHARHLLLHTERVEKRLHPDEAEMMPPGRARAIATMTAAMR